MIKRFTRRVCDGTVTQRNRSFISSAVRRVPPAFVFDIDGVLLRGETVLEPARNAFRILHGDNPYNRKIPYIFLTNGGGVSEEQRCAKLSSQLGFEVSPTQYIQSHTVLKSISGEYTDKPVLVLGGKGDVIRQVVLGYGFNQVYTPFDILAWNKAVHPLHDLTTDEAKSTIHPPVDFSKIKFHAIIVCHDPRNWGMDIQIMCDILLGNGHITGIPTPKVTNDSESTAVKVIFCNPDLLWKNEFDVPRLGQGGFRHAWEAVWDRVKGSRGDPDVRQYGKPKAFTYLFAKDVLNEVVKSHGLKLKTEIIEEERVLRSRKVPGNQMEKLSNVYMVGDNPESDIQGARQAKWNSILVHTGVYDPEKQPKLNGIPKPLPREKRPSWEATDVEVAVKLAIEEELRKERGQSPSHASALY